MIHPGDDVSIRARLTIAMAVVLLVTVAGLGIVAVQTTRATLTNQVDDQVESTYYQVKDKPPKFDDQGQGGQGSNDPDTMYQTEPVATTTDPVHPYRRADAAIMFYDTNGALQWQENPGWADEQLALPQCPDFGSSAWKDSLDHIVTLTSADGSVDYRTLIKRMDNGWFLAVGVPINDANAAVARLMKVVIFATLAALAAATGICWLVIRRGLEPVDHMVATAADIAGGNLGARVADVAPHTELGRLSSALNDMMGRIESSHDAQTASEQKLRRFVADAAHELRTPLTSLRGYAELYRQGALTTPTSVDNAMGRIESEGGRMARLVDDLLLLARMDQDRSLERTPVDLGELVTDAVTDFRVIAPDRVATVEATPDVRVIGDHMRLRQVVDNLLTNVRTHTPPDAEVHVSVAAERGRAVLRVHDTGPGIAPEDQQRIFERFWRADRARSRSRGGSGLGLAIVASLVDAHDGQVAIESASGEGSTFTVSLPLAPAT